MLKCCLLSLNEGESSGNPLSRHGDDLGWDRVLAVGEQLRMVKLRGQAASLYMQDGTTGHLVPFMDTPGVMIPFTLNDPSLSMAPPSPASRGPTTLSYAGKLLTFLLVDSTFLDCNCPFRHPGANRVGKDRYLRVTRGDPDRMLGLKIFNMRAASGAPAGPI
jgi:hypothetical protein